MKKLFYLLFAGLLTFSANETITAQEQIAKLSPETKNEKSDKKDSDASPAKEKTTKSGAQTATDSECESCRWFEPTAATFSMRYRTTTDSDDVRNLNQGQQRIVLAGKFKFDAEGRYTLNVHASSGYYFNWAYADTGLGNTVKEGIVKSVPGIAAHATNDVAPGAIQSAVQNYIRVNYPNASQQQIAQLTPALTAQFTPVVTNQVRLGIINQLTNVQTRSKGWNLYVRQLYFQAKPVDGLELSYGSLGINKGVNSEATSYDDDGYIMGGRVRVMRPNKFWFDEMSVTYAYLGDIFQPNFFRRTERVKQSNYHQFLLRKKLFNGKVDVSTDYTFQDGSDTMREAVLLNVKKSKVLDTIRVEAYQRIGDVVLRGKTFKAGSGFYVQGEKTLFKRLTLNGGYADIDRNYSVYGEYSQERLDWYGFAINGDQTGLGKRFVSKVNYKLTKDLGVSMLYSHAINSNAEDMRFFWNKTHFNVAVTYDILKGAKRLGWFK